MRRACCLVPAALLLASSAGAQSVARDADVRPDSGCERQRTEAVDLVAPAGATAAARDSALADIRYWLRTTPTAYVRSVRVWVALSHTKGVEIGQSSPSDTLFAREALNAVQMAAHDRLFDAFAPADPARTDTVTVLFGRDRAGRPAPYAWRRVCLAIPRPGNARMLFPRSLTEAVVDPTDNEQVVHPTATSGGVVRAIFRVDSVGNVVPGAIVIVSSPGEAFSREVLRTLPSYRYYPATIEGRPTAQVVEQSFEFSLKHGYGLGH